MTRHPERAKMVGSRLMNRPNRSGQVTIYIALSLILLALVGAALYLRKVSIEETLESEVRRIIVAPEAQPMQDFLTSCLEKSTTEGIKLIAEHGGWINPPGRLDRTRPTESEAVTLSPTSDQAIPYWHFMSRENRCTGTCTFSGLAPPLKKPAQDSMESQLDTYLKTHLKTCFSGIDAFKAEGYTITEQGPLTVASTITDRTVTAYASYPLRFDKPGFTTQTNELFTAIPARLGELYHLADQITSAQREHRFLEKHLRQLIDLQSGLGPEQLPPVYEVDIDFSTGKTWAKTQVKQRLKDLLSTFTPFLQVFGTANYRKILAPPSLKDPVLFDRVYNRNMLVITSTERGFPDLEARFIYLPWWEPFFDLNCQGELCRPESLLNTLGVSFGIQRYFFTYDMSFPIMVELRDPDAFQGRGLTFTIMLEANLRNNEPMPGVFQPIVMESGLTDSLFCDPGQLTGGGVSLNATNAKTGKAVDGADLLYTCGPGGHENSTACSIARTDANGRLTSKLPVCLGGTLSILKEGFVSTNLPFDSDQTGTRRVDARIEPIRKIDIDIKRLRLRKTPQGIRLDDEPVSLDPYEEASVSMRKIQAPYDEPYFAVAQQLGDVVEDAKSGMHTGIPLIPGNYSVEVTTILRPDPALTIPPDRRCYEDKCVDAPKEAIVFDTSKPLPFGGARYTVEVKARDLDISTKLTILAIDSALDLVPERERKIEDLDLISDIDKLSASYRTQIEPIWNR